MAFPNDMSRIATGLEKLEASNSSYTANPKKAARNLIRKSYRIDSTSRLANGDDAVLANASPAIRMKNAGRVLGVNVLPRAAATKNTANYATFSVIPIAANGLAGSACASITTANTDGGSMVAGTTYPVTVVTTAGADRYTAGSWLAPLIAMTASGVAIGAASWTIDVEEEDVDGYAV